MSNIFKKYYAMDFFYSGLMAELSPENLQTLLALVVFMDADGVCYPSQALLAKGMGLSDRKVANKRIKKLLGFRFKGQPILTTIGKHKFTNGNSTIKYKLMPLCQFMYGDDNSNRYELPHTLLDTREEHVVTKDTIVVEHNPVVPETDNHVVVKDDHLVVVENAQIRINELESINKNQENKRKDKNKSNIDTNLDVGEKTINSRDVELKNSKDVIKYFGEKYKEKYGVPYSVNFARESSMVKNKLIEVFTPEQIRDIIDITIEHWQVEWANEKHPLPNIGALCTFIPNKALAIANKKRKEIEDLERAVNAPKHGGRDVEKFLAFLEGGSN